MSGNLSIRPTSTDEIEVAVEIMLLEFEEDGIYYLYAPELDLHGYGHTRGEAQKMFDDVVKNYIDISVEDNTLSADLRRNGWMLAEEAVPPSWNVIINRNSSMSERILRNRPVLSSEKLKLPTAYA